MYIAVLSETGLVGLLLYISILGISLLNYWRASRQTNTVNAHLAYTWLVVLVVLLLGGITKHDHYDKLLWLVLGLSVTLDQYHAISETGVV
jgi:O-antigen ligase